MNNLNINTRKSCGYIDTKITIGNYSESSFLSEHELEEQLIEIATQAVGACWTNEMELSIVKSIVDRFSIKKEDLFP